MQPEIHQKLKNVAGEYGEDLPFFLRVLLSSMAHKEPFFLGEELKSLSETRSSLTRIGSVLNVFNREFYRGRRTDPPDNIEGYLNELQTAISELHERLQILFEKGLTRTKIYDDVNRFYKKGDLNNGD